MTSQTNFDTWSNDASPQVLADEQQIDNQNLASFAHILKFAAQYWGGLFGLLAMVGFVSGLIYVVTDAVYYEAIRTWVAACVSGVIAFDLQKLTDLLWRPLLVVGLLVGAYYGLLYQFPKRAGLIKAWVLSAVVLFLATMNVKVGVELVGWSGDFWESIKEKQADKFLPGLLLFAQLAFFSIIAGTYRIFFMQMLQMRWRTWLTENFTKGYLAQDRYYHLNQQAAQDNPDQRIADDLDRFTSLGVTLFFGFYLAALSVYEYAIVLLKLSGDYELDLFGKTWVIHAYMFWAVIVYTLLGSGLIHFIGRRLVKINVLGQRYNANFRYHLVRAREYAEGIAFLRGGLHHENMARRLFADVRSNWFRLMWRTKYVGFASSVYSQTAIIFPIVVAVPRYFSGELKFGGIMQMLRAFGELRDALTWFIDNYTSISEIRAAATRLFGLQAAMGAVDAAQSARMLDVVHNNVGGISLNHVSLNRPQVGADGKVTEVAQVLGLDWQISQGQRWLVSGASGAGKSTVLRAIAGLWPYGRGQVDLPNKAKVLFLPQKPYFPVGSLREALAYPAGADAYKDIAYDAVLDMCQLPHLRERLAEQGNWAQILSGGEQQRLAFARIFLQRPDYLFLDEATASLDIANEQALYAGLVQFLPKLTLISISHHAQLSAFHTHELHFTADAAGGFKASMKPLTA